MTLKHFYKSDNFSGRRGKSHQFNIKSTHCRCKIRGWVAIRQGKKVVFRPHLYRLKLPPPKLNRNDMSKEEK